MTYCIMATIVPVGFGEIQVTVTALAEDRSSVETRGATVRSQAEAAARKDYLVMSLATELRARGDVVTGIEE